MWTRSSGPDIRKFQKGNRGGAEFFRGDEKGLEEEEFRCSAILRGLCVSAVNLIHASEGSRSQLALRDITPASDYRIISARVRPSAKSRR
jgi:hypothetical protein